MTETREPNTYYKEKNTSSVCNHDKVHPNRIQCTPPTISKSKTLPIFSSKPVGVYKHMARVHASHALLPPPPPPITRKRGPTFCGCRASTAKLARARTNGSTGQSEATERELPHVTSSKMQQQQQQTSLCKNLSKCPLSAAHSLICARHSRRRLHKPLLLFGATRARHFPCLASQRRLANELAARPMMMTMTAAAAAATTTISLQLPLKRRRGRRTHG